MNEFIVLLFKSVPPLSPLGEHPRRRNITQKQKEYIELRKERKRIIHTRILEALNGPEAIPIGVLVKMLGENRCKLLKHLYLLEEEKKVTRVGVGKHTKWKLVKIAVS